MQGDIVVYVVFVAYVVNVYLARLARAREERPAGSAADSAEKRRSLADGGHGLADGARDFRVQLCQLAPNTRVLGGSLGGVRVGYHRREPAEGFGIEAGGLLSGKFEAGKPGPAGARRTGFDFPPVDQGRHPGVLTALREVAAAHGVSLARIALTWLLTRPFVTSVIIGARTMEQLRDNLAAGAARHRKSERRNQPRGR